MINYWSLISRKNIFSYKDVANKRILTEKIVKQMDIEKNNFK
jgi:hypothetical protein